jgi:hypothetical protein
MRVKKSRAKIKKFEKILPLRREDTKKNWPQISRISGQELATKTQRHKEKLATDFTDCADFIKILL